MFANAKKKLRVPANHPTIASMMYLIRINFRADLFSRTLNFDNFRADLFSRTPTQRIQKILQNYKK